MLVDEKLRTAGELHDSLVDRFNTGSYPPPRTEQRILATSDSLALMGLVNMPDEEWIKELEDGRKVKFVYQELPEDGAFLTAQLEGNEIVYSIILIEARNPLSREDVESRFKGELSKK